MFSKSALKSWAIIIADTRGCKKPAADLHLICSWYEQDRPTSGQASVDGACTNSRRRLTLTSTRTAWKPESVALNTALTEYIYGCCAGLNLGSESNTGVFRQRCGHSQQTAPTVRLQTARHQKHQSLTLFACFHPVKAITEKKRFSESTIYGSFHPATLSCFATNKAPPATFSPSMDRSTLPPLPSALSVSGGWLTCTVTWLLGVKVHSFVPRLLVQLPPSQCHYFFPLRDSGVPWKAAAQSPAMSISRKNWSALSRWEHGTLMWSPVLLTGEGVLIKKKTAVSLQFVSLAQLLFDWLL